MSVILLNKSLTSSHWSALAVLFAGVVIVQISTLENKKNSSSTPAADATNMGQNPFLGLGAILIAVVCSGLSGVWFEKILKGSPVSLWIRNIQLALISVVISGVTVYTKDWEKATTLGFFTGYTRFVFLVILLQGGGGLVVAVVVKYADNILKGFATSIATILSTIGSMYLFSFAVSPLFLFGAVLVLGSAYMYNKADMNTSAGNVASAVVAKDASFIEEKSIDAKV